VLGHDSRRGVRPHVIIVVPANFDDDSGFFLPIEDFIVYEVRHVTISAAPIGRIASARMSPFGPLTCS
jgi:hypothetical protein